MVIGVPKKIKPGEARVGYAQAGARLEESPEAVWRAAAFDLAEHEVACE